MKEHEYRRNGVREREFFVDPLKRCIMKDSGREKVVDGALGRAVATKANERREFLHG